MEVGQIITLLSGAGIGAVLSAVLLFINNTKKNKLDFITKERSEWRKEIKSIIVDLLSGKNRFSAINRLETQLNPYGRYTSKEDTYEFYMNDGHIWRLVDNFDYSTKSVNVLTKYLELLLKYDWERSKREIKFDIFNSFIYFILVIGSISNSLLILLKIEEFWWKILLIIVSIVMIISIIYFKEFTTKIKKWNGLKLLYIASLTSSMYLSIYAMLFWVIPTDTDIVDMVIPTLLICIPILGIERNIILKANSEEEGYINTLKEIVNKEN